MIRGNISAGNICGRDEKTLGDENDVRAEIYVSVYVSKYHAVRYFSYRGDLELIGSQKIFMFNKVFLCFIRKNSEL